MIKVSGSIVNGSNGFLAHNEREYHAKNIDLSRTDQNIYVLSQSVNEAYNEIFKNAIDEYNNKQTRNDRKKSVKKYIDEIYKNKDKKASEKPFYEVIVQIGDKDTCNCINNPTEANNAKEALLKYYNTWQERNPNLKAFNVALHMDESTPHLHIDYIPVANGYKNGLSTRNSLSKALEQQGLGVGKGKYDNASIKWQEQERKALQSISKEYGFEIIEQDVKREHLTVAEFKKEKEKLNKEMDQNKIKIEGINLPMGRVVLKKEELNTINKKSELQSKKDVLIEKELKSINSMKAETKAIYEQAQQKLLEQEGLLEKAEQLKKEAEQSKTYYDEKYYSQLSLNTDYIALKRDYNQSISELNGYKIKNKELNEKVEKAFKNGYAEGINQSKEEIEKAFKNGEKEGYKQGVNDGVLTALMKTNTVFYQEPGRSLGGKPYTIVEPRTGLKLQVTSAEKANLLVVPKDKIEKVNREIDQVKKEMFVKTMGQGRSR